MGVVTLLVHGELGNRKVNVVVLHSVVLNEISLTFGLKLFTYINTPGID